MSVLDDIISGVREDLVAREAIVPLDLITKLAADAAPALDPLASFRDDRLSVIAEVKRASPSKGHLSDIDDPAGLAAQYETGGAAAISVLTEQRRFRGSLADLDSVRAAVSIPVLRKDFVVTDYQVYEARAHGADLVLLIVAALDDVTLGRLHSLATDLGMTPLVEVHTAEETSRALDAGAFVVGVNNRNLKTLDVDTRQFARLASLIPAEVVRVYESGLVTAEDAARAAAEGADVVLVGEALVRDHAPERAVADLIAAGTAATYRR